MKVPTMTATTTKFFANCFRALLVVLPAMGSIVAMVMLLATFAGYYVDGRVRYANEPTMTRLAIIETKLDAWLEATKRPR